MKDFHVRLTPLYHNEGILDLIICAPDKSYAKIQARKQDPFNGGKISIREIHACQHEKGRVV